MLLVLVLAGCQELRDATNRGSQNTAELEAQSGRDDATSWQGRPVIEVETHPMFSTLPRRVQDLSDGTQLWSFTRCQNYEVPARCTAYPIGTVQFAQCTGGRIDRTCCIRQFRVTDMTVQGFRALGPCVTGCQVRPGGCQSGL
jgi:hypothetical protein